MSSFKSYLCCYIHSVLKWCFANSLFQIFFNTFGQCLEKERIPNLTNSVCCIKVGKSNTGPLQLALFLIAVFFGRNFNHCLE